MFSRSSLLIPDILASRKSLTVHEWKSLLTEGGLMNPGPPTQHLAWYKSATVPSESISTSVARAWLMVSLRCSTRHVVGDGARVYFTMRNQRMIHQRLLETTSQLGHGTVIYEGLRRQENGTNRWKGRYRRL